MDRAERRKRMTDLEDFMVLAALITATAYLIKRAIMALIGKGEVK